MPNLPTLKRNGNAAVAEADPRWPASFDDPTSPYWLPPELRPYYRRGEQVDRRRMVEIGRWGPSAVELPTRTLPDGRDREGRQIDPAGSDEDLQIALHAVACQEARLALAAVEQRADHQAQLEQDRCPWCQRPETALHLTGPRVLRDGTRLEAICRTCRDSAQRAADDLERMPDGRTRMDWAREKVAAAREHTP